MTTGEAMFEKWINNNWSCKDDPDQTVMFE
jgi:hypothetical protein